MATGDSGLLVLVGEVANVRDGIGEDVGISEQAIEDILRDTFRCEGEGDFLIMRED
jgi:hypothetical protein